MTLADGEAPLEAYPEAAAILRDAGWTPHPEWGVFTRATLVMGGTPDALSFHVKDFARIPEGHPSYSADTPDTAEEAAEWLKRRFTPAPVADNPLSLASLETHREEAPIPLALVSEEGENLQDESNGETGEEAEGGSAASDADTERGVREGAASDEVGENYAAPREALESDFLDADFTIEDLGGPDETLELPAPDPEDFAPEDFVPAEDQSGAFIFGDNLHQMRTAAIGLVVQAALTRLPAPTDYGKLSELRNFAMGVSENRWPDDPAKRDELDAMEAIERRRRQIEAARDEKVAFLASEETTREQIEAFDPEAGWPE